MTRRLTLSPGIVERLRLRDPAAFNEVLHAAGPSLLSFLVSYVRSDDTAEDLLQNILFRIFELGDRFAPTESVEAYLFAAARNAAITHLRQAGTQDRYVRRYVDDVALDAEADGSLAAPGVGEWDDELTAIHTAVETLTEHQRIAFDLRYGEGLTIPEIAQILGISAKGVERLMTRIKKLLREQVIDKSR